MSRTVWTFPGQLTEYVGMTKGMLEGSSVLERNLALAGEILGDDLAAICERGPESLLRRDDVAAAAVVTIGASSAADLEGRGFRPDAVAGYSLGFYTAAAAAGGISLEDALRLVVFIGREGGRFFPPGRMAMGFVTGIRIARLEAALAGLVAAGRIAVTNVNTSAQAVIAGESPDVEEALGLVRGEAMRCERLELSRPYHSPWMEPIAGAVRERLAAIRCSSPRLPLFDHRDGTRLAGPELLKRRLAEQLTSRVDWPATVRGLIGEGASMFVEMPPGSSTTRMVRWIDREVTGLALDQSEDRERFLAEGPAPRSPCVPGASEGRAR